ncbi:MAG TPA: tRNA (adenosine(37)-N6)-threonylcarbamoyltransferase complex dimerization subunit type 1 TsaB [Candidatus Marinimicrobia bacterium]|nr:tRNA (adenosine(37)-N6)-threonylcarbamoyltransferase complex dimerization subunit type 1 TsaB [Candidatus Neomarinimicrobiota bacterium]
MNILGIDTSTNNCSVGVVADGKIIARKAELGRSIASERLIDLIKEMLQTAVSMEAIDAIAVSIGPGSYTGLRIGLSTAKGLAYPEKLPLLPVPTIAVLEHIAHRTLDSDLVVLIKSHRDLAYHTLCQKEKSPDIDSFVVGYDTFAAIHRQYGDRYPYISPSEIRSDFITIEQTLYPEGDIVALLAYHNYQRLISRSSPELEPLYLSEFEVKKWKDRSASG